MADNRTPKTYPHMPASNWWDLRKRFTERPPTVVDVQYLKTVLNFKSDKAAQNLLPAIRAAGLIDKDGVPTDRANRWRFDASYRSVCDEISEELYPPGLLEAVADPMSDPDAVVRWFMSDTSKGRDYAQKMASFYQLLAKADPAEGAVSTTGAKRSSARPTAGRSAPAAAATRADPEAGPPSMISTAPARAPTAASIDPRVNINIQIHIAADAGPEQIESIFSSMAKHLNIGRR